MDPCSIFSSHGLHSGLLAVAIPMGSPDGKGRENRCPLCCEHGSHVRSDRLRVLVIRTDISRAGMAAIIKTTKLPTLEAPDIGKHSLEQLQVLV